MNIAIIIGHEEKAQGARTYNGISEYKFNTYIANALKDLHEFKKENGLAVFSDLKVISRDHGWGAVQSIIAANSIDMTVELHFNSFSGIARGVEVLCISGDKSSEDFAAHLASKIAKEFRSPLRHGNGVFDVTKKERGFNNLNLMKASGAQISVLVEPGFLNYKTAESFAIVEEPTRYVNILYRSIESYIDLGEADA